MRQFKSLLILCIESVSTEIIHGRVPSSIPSIATSTVPINRFLGSISCSGDHDDHRLVDVASELPSDLFDLLLKHLPPMALHLLHTRMPTKHNGTLMCSQLTNERKRGRYDDFNIAWETLFKSRWPEIVGAILPYDKWTKQGMKRSRDIHIVDWHQMYWEAHLQNCLDKAAEMALLPSFDGCISDVTIPGSIVECIGYSMNMSDRASVYWKLSYHCQQFGRYARCLRFQNVLCVSEICDLLRDSKLENIVLRRIRSNEHINGACKLLLQNNESLCSIEFIYCKFSSDTLNAICSSLYPKDILQHGLQYFSIKASIILENDLVPVPSGFISLLSSGRSLYSLIFCDNHLGPRFAKMIFDTLLDSPSGLFILDMSENNITGWLSNINGGTSRCFGGCLEINNSLWSLRVLNLRGNNLRKDDADTLKNVLVQMPNLEYLDVSDNPIEDEGVKYLIPYFVQASTRDYCLLELKMENCDLSSVGVTRLLGSLYHLKNPLNSLSLGDNDVGSEVAEHLARFLGSSCVKVLNVEDIGLGPSGFRELCEKLPKKTSLVEITVSKNRGGKEAAKFISELILRAPELVALDASYNFIPSDSLADICYALKHSKGKLRKLDLTGNTGCYQSPQASILAEFQIHGKPVVVLPSLCAPVPYDDDP
ncbi:hypothetical protein Sjap_006209 [Stephania japonica]|uniref:Uncharacterized protein n=1 Tax=Stephania japonica TaxID=461633 RepID=A0AAP0PMK9_9MAGN